MMRHLMCVLPALIALSAHAEDQSSLDRLVIEMHAGQDHDSPAAQKRDAADRQREVNDAGFRKDRDAEFVALLAQMRSVKPKDRWAAEQAILKSTLLAAPDRHKQFAEEFAAQFQTRGVEYDAALRIFASFADASDIPRLKALLRVEGDFFAGDHLASRLYRLEEKDCALEFWNRVAKDKSHPCQFAAIDRLEKFAPEAKPQGPVLAPAK